MTFATYPSVNEITRNAGFLYWGPTSLLTEAGYGTLLGYVDSLVFKPNLILAEVADEETGANLDKMLVLGSKPNITVGLKNYNATVLARAFPGFSSATHKSVSWPGSILPGLSVYTTHQGTLLYVPDNTTSDFVILLKTCFPHITQAAALALSHSKEVIFPITFLAKSYYLGLLSGASL